MKIFPSLSNVSDPNFGKPMLDQNILLQELGRPHTNSFNYMVNRGIDEAVSDLHPIEFDLSTSDRLKFAITAAVLERPLVPMGAIGVRDQVIKPKECRQRKSTYKGRFTVTVRWSVNGKDQQPFIKDMGEIPIMVKSNRCHLENLSPGKLVEFGEHEQEWGGYFIIKGLERLVRMLQVTRRNYPITIKRSGWKERGTLFSDCGVSIRCVKLDHTTTSNVLHFVKDGTAKFMFSHRKMMYYAPLVLIMKCLVDYCDRYIYKLLTRGFESDTYYSDCVLNMLRNLHEENLHTHDDCKMYLGKMFRVKFFEVPPWKTDAEVAEFILERCVLIHLKDNTEKFNLLSFMTQKLFVFAQDKCKVEGADGMMTQELLTGGQLYLQILKEKMQNWLGNLRISIIKSANARTAFSLTQSEILKAARQAGSFESAFEFFFATGNLSSQSGLGLMQDKGLTIVPENINRMRYMSHFKAIHRGAFFMEMRTTEVRRLLPESWGFVCPVHTPDGAPCGLLNHLTMNCTVTDAPEKSKIETIPNKLIDLGMVSINDISVDVDYKNSYVTMLDGKILGWVHKNTSEQLIRKLRLLKINGEIIPETLEIVLVPFKKHRAQYPGLFLFTGPGRMMRPVINLAVNKIEMIGTFEQIYMNICVKLDELYEGITTHKELTESSILSNLAQLIPMPDCNQSPRNMYQCQMGKQTMGTPCQNWDLQAATKLYRLQTPATPLFRPVHYDNISLDDFPMGTNAIVAVISYTGYDMEDAIVVNKSSYERGFGHGSIYKSEFIELDHASSYFCRDPALTEQLSPYLDTDGLPYIGRKISDREPFYSYYNSDQSKFSVVKFNGKETSYVNSVRLCGDFNVKKPRMACISLRVPRNPNVGDKFASRAGQKGILSYLWPSEDLPFTETGMVPDVMFNPHGFPSRMTIAMMIEVMAGKSASVHGLVHDATPFRFNEKDTAIDYFGKLLQAGGYNYYGTETLYSGVDGREMKAQIFFGVVHYQRLRHMVSDKWQVRSTGPVDVITRQPIKGRKRGGGVRFGEMERDALLSHGASFLLQDRLFHNSDKTTVLICTTCSSLLGPISVPVRIDEKAHQSEWKDRCIFCKSGKGIQELEIPYIFKFFVTQLASCNIHLKLECKHI